MRFEVQKRSQKQRNVTVLPFVLLHGDLLKFDIGWVIRFHEVQSYIKNEGSVSYRP
jgi:hypothetical protein